MEDIIKIVITDSGLGGLSIFAEAYEKLKLSSFRKPIDLIFSNALPETGRGYNRIPDLSKRIEIFNNVLNGMEKYFQPDLIGIACNTLSVLIDRTDFFIHHHSKIVSIVETGLHYYSNTRIKPDDYLVIFGTETTIASDVHRQRLLKQGIPPNQIITQECPQLASEIEFDYQSDNTKNIIDQCVCNVLSQLTDKKAKVFIYLACTHYGYVSDYFLASFQNNGFSSCTIINPNQSMVEFILKYVSKLQSAKDLSSNDVIKIRILSRCVILPEEIQSISKLILPISKDTVQALEDYELKDDLFEV